MNINKTLAILESHFAHQINLRSYELSQSDNRELSYLINTFEKYKNAVECLALVQKMKADKNEQSEV